MAQNALDQVLGLGRVLDMGDLTPSELVDAIGKLEEAKTLIAEARTLQGRIKNNLLSVASIMGLGDELNEQGA